MTLVDLNDQETLKSCIGQTYLSDLGYYGALVDGEWGPISRAAAASWHSRNRAEIMSRVIPARRRLVEKDTATAEVLRTLAAQFHLADKGLYTGELDADWGPLSTKAAKSWNGLNRASFQTPYDVAKHYIGVKEIPGKQHNSTILNWYRRLIISIFDDETAWCSTFVNFCALEAGYERTGKLNARSWLNIGLKIPISDARPGDVLIFERGNSGWEGHVTFFVSASASSARCLGGNQNDEVNIATYSLSKLLGVRRLRSLDALQGASNKI
jgi:uncharacterized protein (TIGR02594 family)